MKRRPMRQLSTFESFEYRRLQAILRQVRWRWRLRVLLRGVALLLLTGLATVAAASWGVDAARYAPWAVTILGLATYAGLAYAAFRFVVRPLSRRVTDRQVALYVEEHAGLKAALLSAVEFGALGDREVPRNVSAQFVTKVVHDAVQRGREIDYGKRVELPELRRVGGYLGGALATLAVLVLINPSFLRHGVPALFRPFAGAEVETPYAIDVLPGSIEVARGSDQLVAATLVGFDSDTVEVSYRVGEDDWRRETMAANADSGRFEFLLLRLAGDVEYFVEAAAVRSAVHRLSVVDRPHVDRIDLDLEFPAYSGLSPQRIEDGGDVAALPGTRVTLTITPTVAVPAGRLLLDAVDGEGEEADPVPLAVRAGAPQLTGSFTVDRPGFYRVELQTPDGDWLEASSEYLVEVLSDQPPVVSIERPGRDVEVTSVEEVFTEASVEDDFGVGSLDLVWTLNGGDEQRVALFAAPRDGGGEHVRKDASGAHTFYLEEFDLVPGDFIAYWVEATDNRDVGAPQQSATDIYFIQVRPFEREFRQGEGGGGGGGGSQLGLAEQQRQVVAATFKLVRDGRLGGGGGPTPGMEGAGTRTESLEFLAGREDALRDQAREASAMFGQLEAEASMDAMEYLSEADDALVGAADRLRADAPDEALPVEQRALQYLQRFEALFRQMQIAQGQGGGGGGAGGDMERIADMLDLGTEELENQYESVRRGQQEQMDNTVDEALQRLQELSRRQQQEIERQRAAGSPSGGGGGRNANQRELADQAEELARQLERLSRDNSRPDLQEAANRLQQAADAMRQAAARGGQQSSSDGSRALNELENARRLLDEMRGNRLERDLAQARDKLAEMRETQASIEREVERLGEPGGRNAERVERLLERKDGLAEDMRDLEHQLDDMARESRTEQMRTSRELKEAADWMRDEKLADKVRYSKGVVQERDPRYAADFERDISDDLAALEERLAAADEAVEVPEGERLTSALDDTRDLVRRLESFEERARDAGEGRQAGQAGPQGGQQGQGQDGEQGQGQDGQPGQQAGEGQQGQRQGGQQQGLGGQPGGAISGVPGQRQLQREFTERLGDAERLREALAEEGVQVTDLDNVIAAMRDFNEEFTGTARGLDELRDEVIDGLKLFEFWLRRVTDASSGDSPQLAGSDRVPEGYRELVEEYFRALARGEDGGQR